MSTALMVVAIAAVLGLGWLLMRSTESDQEANMRLHALIWRIWEDGK